MLGFRVVSRYSGGGTLRFFALKVTSGGLETGSKSFFISTCFSRIFISCGAGCGSLCTAFTNEGGAGLAAGLKLVLIKATMSKKSPSVAAAAKKKFIPYYSVVLRNNPLLATRGLLRFKNRFTVYNCHERLCGKNILRSGTKNVAVKDCEICTFPYLNRSQSVFLEGGVGGPACEHFQSLLRRHFLVGIPRIIRITFGILAHGSGVKLNAGVANLYGSVRTARNNRAAIN